MVLLYSAMLSLSALAPWYGSLTPFQREGRRLDVRLVDKRHRHYVYGV